MLSAQRGSTNKSIKHQSAVCTKKNENKMKHEAWQNETHTDTSSSFILKLSSSAGCGSENTVCCVYINLLYLSLSVLQIWLQQTSSIIFIWDDQHNAQFLQTCPRHKSNPGLYLYVDFNMLHCYQLHHRLADHRHSQTFLWAPLRHVRRGIGVIFPSRPHSRPWPPHRGLQINLTSTKVPSQQRTGMNTKQ